MDRKSRKSRGQRGSAVWGTEDKESFLRSTHQPWRSSIWQEGSIEELSPGKAFSFQLREGENKSGVSKESHSIYQRILPGNSGQ